MQTPDRRGFLMGSLAAAGTAALAGVAEAQNAGGAGGERQVYEMRKYILRRGPMQKRADDYFKDALIPACGRAGAGPVGVFNVALGPDSPTSYVLLVHKGIESVATLGSKLAADSEYQKAGSAFITAPAADPSYVNLKTQIMLAIGDMPRIEPPERKGRIFELRTYRSHSMAAALKKIEMFGSGGELKIFRRVGLTPVFFGQTIAGSNMPNLTYMLTYPDMAGRDKAWSAFGGDPEWRKLSQTPGFTDPEIVAGISNILLRPAGYSQV